ncbi:MAG: WD40 repeat domain-containing serine/threonine protein kinase [Planctomycetota bacterium]
MDEVTRYRTLTRLFEEARDLPPEQLGSLLAATEPADLRGELEAMLAADRAGAPKVRTIVDVSGVIAEANEAPEIPSEIGGYRVLGTLGQGGGGIVLKAESPADGATVAVKVLGVGAWDSRALSRFRREIKLLGHLSHPGVARILDAGVDRSGVSPHPYFVMEFVDGPSLSAWLRAERRDARQVAALFAEIADAVAYSHARGIIHRDLKPGNVLVDAAGHARILDFGVAAVASDIDPAADPLRTLTMTLGLGRTIGDQTTRGDAIMGTLPYMSPEQFMGARMVDARSDLYSIGVMLYESLAGRLPYDIGDRSIPDAAAVIRDEMPSRIGRFDATLRGDLEIIVSRLLEKRPQDRYQSAADLAEDLRRFLRGERTKLRKLARAARVARFVRRYPVVSAALIVLGLACAGLAGFVVVNARLERSRAAEAAIERETASQERYRDTLQRAWSEVESGIGGRLSPALLATEPTRRGWEWGHLASRNATPESTFRVFYHARSMQIAKGRGVYIAGSDFVYAFAPNGGPLSCLSDITGVRQLAIAPDGAVFASCEGDDGMVMLRAVDDGRVVGGVQTGLRVPTGAAWSPQGSSMLVSGADGRVALVELPTGATRVVAEVEAGEREPPLLAFSTDGSRALIGRRDDSTLAVVGRDASESRRISVPGGGMRSLAATAVDGRMVALVGTGDGEVVVVDLERAEVLRRMRHGAGAVTVLAVSESGALVAAGSDSAPESMASAVKVWRVDDGVEMGTLIGAYFLTAGLAFAESDALLIGSHGDGTMRQWRLDESLVDPRAAMVVPGGGQRIEEIGFDAGGALVGRIVDAQGSRSWKRWDWRARGRVEMLAGEPASGEASGEASTRAPIVFRAETPADPSKGDGVALVCLERSGLDRTNGGLTERWRRVFAGSRLVTAVAPGAERVIVATEGGEPLELDARDGAELMAMRRAGTGVVAMAVDGASGALAVAFADGSVTVVVAEPSPRVRRAVEEARAEDSPEVAMEVGR